MPEEKTKQETVERNTSKAYTTEYPISMYCPRYEYYTHENQHMPKTGTTKRADMKDVCNPKLISLGATMIRIEP